MGSGSDRSVKMNSIYRNPLKIRKLISKVGNNIVSLENQLKNYAYKGLWLSGFWR